jgi:glycosyltransferase involved in cell wall biosynthesis
VSRPRVLLLRGHHTNAAELLPWQLLTDRYDIASLVTGSTEADLADLPLARIPVRARRDLLPGGGLFDLALRVPGDAYRGLKRHLDGAAIVHSAELGVWFSRQAAVLKEQLGYRFLITVWETIPLRETFRTARAGRYRAETIPAVDLFLATTERARQSLELEGVPAERIVVCQPGVDLRRLADTRRSPGALVVSPGRLVWEKGHQDVLRALAAVRRGLVGPVEAPRLLIAGAGPEERRLRRYAADLGVDDLTEIRRVPYAEMPRVYAEAACVVLASLPVWHWEEQFGLVLAEAMAAGVPIVAAASGAIPEVLDGHGALVYPGDWLGIARAIAAPPEPAPRALAERYSAAAAADRIAAAYERVLR